jgi:hypothetical protein
MTQPARAGAGCARLVLRYNALVGRDPLPRIRELASRLGLELRAEQDEVPASGKRIKVVSVSGAPPGLTQLERSLLRFPAVTAKLME